MQLCGIVLKPLGLFLYLRRRRKTERHMNFTPLCFQGFRTGRKSTDSLEDLLEDFEEDI
jgi:hypothetical protein